MKKKELQHFRQLLLEELERIADSLGRLERTARSSSQKDSSGDLSAYSIHSADLGSDAMEREKDLLLASRGSRTAVLIQEALRRMDEGTYGTCEECGKAIPSKRLELLPYAALCSPCQVNSERNNR